MSNPELRKYTKAARKAGWRVEQRNGHIKCYSPDGKTLIVMPTTSKSLRGYMNTRASFRRAGLEV